MPQHPSPLWPHRKIKPPYGSVEIDRAHPLAAGLQSCWLFNEGVKTLIDLGGVCPPGVFAGTAVVVNTAIGPAVDFDGDSDYITLADAPYDFTGDFSVIVKVVCDNVAGTNTIASKAESGGWSLANTEITAKRFNFTVRDGAVYRSAVTDVDAVNGTWYHLVGVRSGNTLRIYENGVAQATTGTMTTGYGASAYPLCFGVNPGASYTNYLNGRIAHASTYTRALSPSEILALYADPYCFLRPRIRRAYGFVSGGVTDNTETPGQGALTLTGQQPSLGRTFLAAAAAGVMAITGLAPTVLINHNTAPAHAAIVAAGEAPTLQRTYLTQPGQGALTVAGEAPTLQRTYLTQPGQGALTFAGEIPEAKEGAAELEEPGLGTLAVAGHAPTVTRDHTIPVGQGTLALAGHTPTLAAFKIELRQDSTVITTWDLVLTSSLTTSTHDLDPGERALITDWSALRYALIANGSRVEVTWLELETPAQSSLWYAYPGVGTVALTGQTPYALLGGNYLIPVPHGTLTATGQAPEVLRGGSFVVPVGTGTLAFTGHLPTVTPAGSYTVEVPTGALTVTGQTPVVPKFTLALLQGATTIASWTWYPPATLGTWTYDLTAAERALITNWAILRYKLVASTKRVEVTWLELEVPAEVASNPSPAFASLAFAGRAPNVWVTGAKVPGTGDLGFAGHAPTIDAPGTERPGQGALTFLGQAPTISSPHEIAVGHGSLTLAGQRLPNTMLRLYQGLTLKAERTLTLTDAFTTYNLVLTAAEFASITDWTTLQIAITADNVPVSVSWLQLVGGLGTAQPAAGGLTFVGQAPTLVRGHLAQPGAGALTLTGQPPVPRQIQPDAGALTITGQTPTLQRTFLVTPGTGALVVVGTTPTLPRDHTIAVPHGTLAFGQHRPVPRQSGTAEIRPADMVGGLYTQGDRTGGVR